MTNSNETVKPNAQTNNTEDNNESVLKIRKGDWMIKPCDAYLEEYKDCKSFMGRFYQNFYFGETLNCTQWNIDYKNCKKWQQNDDDTAYNELLESEKKHRFDRLQPHLMNDVWKRRKVPPSDWNEPLPEWMVKQQEGTLLACKNKIAIKGGKGYQPDPFITSCTIL